MSARRVLVFILGLAAVALFLWWTGVGPRHPSAESPTVATAPASPSTATGENRASKDAPPAIEHSPIADQLNAPGGTIRRDLELLNDVFAAWQTNFPHDGNPVGENVEITAALAGKNPLHFAFLAPNHPAIDAHGELCDRWGTPFFFHAQSGTRMEIRSAGPDKKLYTADDIVFSP